MSGLGSLVGAGMASHMESLGWTLEQAEVKEVLPVAARGNNLVVVTPPSAAHALPLLAGVCHALTEGAGLRGLVLVPTGALGAWARVLSPLAQAAGLRLHAGEAPARAARHLAAGTIDLLLTTPDTAAQLQQRATLKVDALRAVVLAWPELWAEAERPLSALMTDLPKEAQRAVLTADAAAVAGLVERYARKAVTFGVPGHDEPALPPLGPVRTVAVAEGARARAVGAVLETLDPASAAVWALDAMGAVEAREALVEADVLVVTGEAPAAAVVIAWDLPTRAQLTQLLAAGEVVLFVPPQAEPWAARTLAGRRPLRLADAADAARTDAARRRGEITARLGAGTPTAGLLALAPLFERQDPTLVAAALYELWSAAAAPVAAAAAAAAVAAAPQATAKMWMGIGETDGLQAKDVMGLLLNEVKLDKAKVGKIEIRDRFTLVELPAAEVGPVAEQVTGKTLKRRRIIARADRPREGGEGAPRGVARGGPRGGRPDRGPRKPRM
ncbi:MAG TPA: DbpA RNA binding domain-containing protein [Gemmatimonadales bacterium]|nr:DbpA RNA binding domain-containing protein [Gemmatimonadales bacterium]